MAFVIVARNHRIQLLRPASNIQRQNPHKETNTFGRFGTPLTQIENDNEHGHLQKHCVVECPSQSQQPHEEEPRQHPQVTTAVHSQHQHEHPHSTHRQQQQQLYTPHIVVENHSVQCNLSQHAVSDVSLVNNDCHSDIGLQRGNMNPISNSTFESSSANVDFNSKSKSRSDIYGEWRLQSVRPCLRRLLQLENAGWVVPTRISRTAKRARKSDRKQQRLSYRRLEALDVLDTEVSW